ncbi:MAG: nitroreductase family protein [Planctomycetes bacterium]|nr:nitroreductase family protein [Planctomycetota bacterium]
MPKQVAFFDVVKRRRSVRDFLPEPVPIEVLQSIVAAGLEAPSGCNAQFRQYIIVTDPAVMARLGEISPALKTAPAAIVQLIEPKATRYGEFYLQDAAASIENMLLAAVALGYAGCWVEGQVRQSYEAVCKMLGVPAEVNVSAIVPIGKPVEIPERPAKPTLADVTHYNRFGGKGLR